MRNGFLNFNTYKAVTILPLIFVIGMTVLGKRIIVESNKTFTLRGRITKHQEVDARHSRITLVDNEWGMAWNIRVPNSAVDQIGREVKYKGEKFKIY